ncbi:nuclear transport factor 2 family protein [Chitinophaga filiformis]|uniref:nuclear transport factor 2 family protein n=1 Tax=Chitinophaga filiformis TaxID=104663 RepID=UPI001F22D53C|nr:nuclear transport factor 2 family protein [Chitinophaga filiformis]MCF6406390.1 nuclear transport factor 2 family protein [Chitinophaga filiformis]
MSYLNALNEGDLGNVLGLFTDDAIVLSPLYGKMNVKEFYIALFSDTSNSSTELLNIFLPATGNKSLALHFNYKWKMKNDFVETFECVDVFNLNDTQDKFTKLTIIYDTYKFRDNFSRIRSQG